MALITIQRNASIIQNVSEFVDQSSETNDEIKYSLDDSTDVLDSEESVNECYFAVRGAAIILPHEECIHVYKSVSKNSSTNDIQKHLQSMFLLLRPEDTLKMAVKLESIYANRTRYLIIVNYVSQTEESCLLGIDYNNEASIGLVLPVWADTRITLDGDGGFSITSYERHHIFKPVSVQAMWSALQALHKASAKSRQNNYFEGGSSHSWIKYYEKKIVLERSSYNEWHAMDDLINRRPPSPDLRTKPPEQVATEQLIRAKLKEVMMSENLDEVTSKYIRTKLEKELNKDLSFYKSFIDEEMIRILGQMDESSQIFDYLYLGSEWNASNYEELKGKGVGKILNVTREIDNFFPGLFDYYNIRVYDDDSTEMLKYWDNTFRYIRKARDEGSKVLVHCKKGISRSASVVLAFVMKETGWKLGEALEYVRNKRNCIRPNSGFLKQLEIYEGILDASKHRHNSLWRSKSETNLVSKDIRLKRKNNDEFVNNNKNRLNKQMNEKNDSNKENSNSEIFLAIPGSVERPKSWSPEDSIFNQTFGTEKTNVREVKNKKFSGRQRFGTDPSCYNIVEAMKNIESNLNNNSDSDIKASLKSPRVSIVKDRIIDFEAFPQSQSTTIGDTLKVSNSSGLVSSLANQFESTHSNTTKRVQQKEVMSDLSNIEPPPKGMVQCKPPIPKSQLSGDKLNARYEPQENCDKTSKSLSFDSSKCPPISPTIKLKDNSFNLNKFYVRDKSMEFQPFSDTTLVSIGSVINTRRKAEESCLKRTNSYDSILKELSLSLFESQSTQRSQNDSKGHKRSTSLYSNPNKWTTVPQTSRWPSNRSNTSLNDQMDWKTVDKGDRLHSKSMPSVIEAVNEVLCSTRVVMNSLFESIPNSKIKTNFDFSVSMDCESIEDRLQSKDNKSLNESKKSSYFRPIFKTKDSEGVVKRLKEKIEAKVKGNKCGDSCECGSHDSHHSHSTPSSPIINREERTRSSTLNESRDGQKGKPFRKTSFDFPFKRIKSQSFDVEIQSNGVFISEMSSNSSNKLSKKRSETELTHKIQTQTKIDAINSGPECRPTLELGIRRTPIKKQQGKSHPLSRLMPQNSKFKNSSAVLNTM